MFREAKLKARIKELEEINEQHRIANGKLREKLDHLKDEVQIWKEMYEKEQRGGADAKNKSVDN